MFSNSPNVNLVNKNILNIREVLKFCSDEYLLHPIKNKREGER